MKNLIKLSILVTMSIFANFVFAQRSSEEKTKLVVTKLTEKLVLSAEQQQKLNDIFINHFNSVKDLRLQFKNSDKEAGKKEIKEEWNRTEQQVLNVLNDAQKPKYHEAKKEMRKNLHSKLKNNGRGKGMKKTIEKDTENILDDEAY